MINIVTPPSIVDSDNHKILVVNMLLSDIELVIAAARTLNQDFDLYFCASTVDTEWYNQVSAQCDRVFKEVTFAQVHEYMKEVDA
jgi:hypothetical protein